MKSTNNGLLFRTVPSIKRLVTDQLHDISSMILQKVLAGESPCFTSSTSHNRILLDLYEYIDITDSIVVIGKEWIDRSSPKIKFFTIFKWSDKFQCSREMKNPHQAIEIFSSEQASNFLFSHMAWIEDGLVLTTREVHGILESLATANEAQVWLRTNRSQIYSNFVGRSFSPVASSKIVLRQGGLVDDSHVMLFQPKPSK